VVLYQQISGESSQEKKVKTKIQTIALCPRVSFLGSFKKNEAT